MKKQLWQKAKQTKSGMVVEQQIHWIGKIGAVLNNYKVELTREEESYYAAKNMETICLCWNWTWWRTCEY